jgi:SRSO17 transposase
LNCSGHTFIDRALYLPKAWTEDEARLVEGHAPERTSLATKPCLALNMIVRAAAAPLAWVAADSAYGAS